MWIPTKLTLKDFMGHIDSSLLFVAGRAYMIYGTNEVDEGQRSNGSGKSAILEAICIATLSETLRSDTTTKDLVRRGEKSFTIGLSLVNSSTKNTLHITRTVFSNTKSSELTIEENGIVLEDITGVDHGNRTILEKLGISRVDLINYFFINKEQYKGGFLKMSDTAKKEIIGRFSQSNLIDPIYTTIDSEIQQINNKITPLQSINTQNLAKIELLKTQVAQLPKVDDLIIRRNNRLSIINASIAQSKYDIKYNQWCIDQIEYSQVELFENLTNLQETLIDQDLNGINKSKEEINDILEELTQEITVTNEIKSKYVNLLLGMITCPECNHEFIAQDTSLDTKELRCKHDEAIDLLQEISTEKQQNTQELILIENSIKETKNKIDQIEQSIRNVKSQLNELAILMSSYSSSIKSQQGVIEDLLVEKQTILDYVIEDRSQSINTQIDQFQLIVDNNDIEITTLTNQLDVKSKMYADFIKFRTHLSNTAIGVIEYQCNEYLNRMGSDLKLVLEGYKINKTNKQIVEKITPSVERMGQQIKFGTLSSGEKARIDVAIILSLQKLINANVDNHGGLDLCFLDEIIESVDSMGMEGLMSSLDSLQQTIIVVTHSTFDKVYDNTIHVKKTKQLGSQILYE